MHSDCYFTTGSSHSICQDYALARDSYIILSDGCSSSPHTDFGSRFLTHSLDQVFQSMRGDHKTAIDRATTMALMHARNLGLPDECIDATLLYVRVTRKFAHFGMCGDGTIAVRFKDGRIDVITAEYESGAPYYPSYEMDQDRKELYLNKFGRKRTESLIQFAADGNVSFVGSTSDTESFAWPIDGIDTILIMSDGILSFLKTVIDDVGKRKERMLLQDVVMPLMAFKLMKGKFVERRTRRFLKECQKNGIQHYDDVSVAGISL